MEGWNGHVCANPAGNTFCVGDYSYPGDQIKLERKLDWEMANRGKACSTIDGLPPCIYSTNAFGKGRLTAYADPPEWYPANDTVNWELPPSTVCIWPFEQMYRDEVRLYGKGP